VHAVAGEPFDSAGDRVRADGALVHDPTVANPEGPRMAGLENRVVNRALRSLTIVRSPSN
jgi:hypothetical protein